MAKKLWKPTTLMAPMPVVLVASGTPEKPNVMTAAWTGIVNTHPAMTYVSIRETRLTHELISKSGDFTINMVTKKLVRAADFCGVRGGRDVDKFRVCALTAGKSSTVSAPTVLESPVTLECRVDRVLQLGSHDMFLAKILAVQVDEELIDDSGKLHIEQAKLAAFAHGEYFTLGESVGTFGYSVKKK